MLSELNLLLLSFVTLFTAVIVTQDMTLKPFSIIPWVVSLFNSFQSRKSIIEKFWWLKSWWEVNNIDLNFISNKSGFRIYSFDTEVEVMNIRLDSKHRFLKDSINHKLITSSNGDKINKISTDLNLESRSTVKLIQINSIIKHSTGWISTSINENDRNVEFRIICIDINHILKIRELNISTWLNSVTIHWVSFCQ